MKLTGWQRLWILLSVILLLLVALFTFEFMRIEFRPKEFQLEYRRLSATMDLIQEEAWHKVKVADGTIIVNVPKGISKEDLEQLNAQYKYNQAQAAEFEEWVKRQSVPEPAEAIPPPLRELPPEKPLDFAVLIREPTDLLAQVPKSLRAPKVDDPAAVKARVQRKHEEYGKWIDFSEIESRYKNNLRQLRWEKAKIGMYGVLAWLTSIGLLYLLGAAIGWVFKGFKSRGDT